MAVPQIAIRIPASSKAAFEQYAAGFGLKASHLAKLLIMRERNRKRLARLYLAGELPVRSRRPRGAGRLLHITAHVSSVAEQTEFDEYASSCGLSRDGAGQLLLETELSERWLEKALQSK